MQKLFVIVAVSLLISTAASGQKTASGGSAPADIVYGRPGQLVAVNGFRLNLYCMGSGSPTVVFDSGWEDWSPAWSTVQPQIAKWTRACSYDRAGAGFSDPGPMPRTSARIAAELHTALHHAGIAGPYILVGHAFGGDNVRTFADLYMSEVAGLVLVDADPDDLEPKAMQEEAHRGQVRFLSRVRDCRNAVAEHKPLPMLTSRPGQPERTCAQQFFRGLPDAAWSPELNARLLEIAETKVAMYDAYLSEMEQVPQDEAYLQRHRRSFGSRPIRVLTSGNHGVGHLETKPADTPDHLKYEQETTQAQARWLGLSSNAKQIFARHSSEYIQFDEPETVINAIRDVYDEARSSSTTPRRKKPSAASSRSTSDAFRDCPVCPEMVVLPAGGFTMGSSAEEKSWAASHGGSMGAVADEAPQHQVSLASFALGEYDVTRGEYAAFARETGYPAGDGCGRGRAIFKWEKDSKLTWENPGHVQTDRDPVVCVSWNDAQAYVAWLNKKTGRTGAYHLPSESEWEYAARAGTTTKFWWGDDDAAAPVHAWFNANSGCQNIQGLFCDGGQTHPVGTKPPNAFGLYDMAGNVWQWTEDCYDNSYAGIPADGRANETPSSDPKANDGQGNCLRVDRGSSWMFPAWLLRPATRERNPADYRNAVMGFRVAKTLP